MHIQCTTTIEEKNISKVVIRRPSAISTLDNRVGLKPEIVAVVAKRVKNRISKRSGVNIEVSHYQILEYQPERLPVLKQIRRRHAQ